MTFYSPSFRAASSDLTIAISPLGLVELADEEFEVHGPRLNRYAQNWAFYLGHHWGYRREIGEPQLTFNYARALADYLNGFSFGRGVAFQTPKATAAIVPNLLKRIWEIDNKKHAILWEMGNQGGVSGDCFVKVAYEAPYQDPSGRTHPGRVRIMPLNSSFCLDENTEILTSEGWKDVWEAKEGDLALCLDPETDEIRWEPIEAMNRFDWDGPVTRWSNERFDAVSTDDHRWVVEDWRAQNPKYRHLAKHRIKTTEELNAVRQNGMRLITGGGSSRCFASEPKWADEVVETVGWYVTEGHLARNAVVITQDEKANPQHVDRIRGLVKWWQDGGSDTSSEYSYEYRATSFWLRGEVNELLRVVAPGKRLTPEFLLSLTYAQACLLYETLLDGDGHRKVGDGPVKTELWYQSHRGRIDDFQMLASMLGKRTQARFRDRLPADHPYRGDNDCEGEVTAYSNRTTNVTDLRKDRYHYKGIMWCPTTPTGTWLARRKEVRPPSDTSNGDRGSSGRQVCYWTGNCFP